MSKQASQESVLRRGLFVAALLMIAMAGEVLAGGGPENLLLVVNGESGDSLAVANEYTRLRAVPPCNVVYLKGLPPGPHIKVEDFRTLLLRPIMEAMDRRELTRQIDYVVYSAGFPYAVEVTGDMTGKSFPLFVTQPASLTGLTYLHELVSAGNTEYLSLNSNWYMRRIKDAKADAAWNEADKRQQEALAGLLAKCEESRKKAAESKTPIDPERARWLEEAVILSRSLSATHPNNPEILYNLACILALQQKADEAMAALNEAYKAGWWNEVLTQVDPDLASLREREDFKALLEKMRQVVIETQPPRAFESTATWMANGDCTETGEGRRYLLSAMLAYTGGPANSLAEALTCLRQSAAADGTHPDGTIYFMSSNDWARTGPRQWAFRSASEALKKLGIRAVVETGVLPADRQDVAGAMIGVAGFAWKDCGSRILPGAFCDHLTSFGGVMTGAGQTLLSEFLRHGAAGSCGTVTEPYNVQSKFPTPFLHFYYASGCSLAESFYQSVYGPYQQLLVGDPLCQPWAKTPVVKIKGLSPGETIKRPRQLVPQAESALPVNRFELFLDGRLRQSCKPGGKLNLNPEGLAEGYHEARVVAFVGALDTQGRSVVPFRVGKRDLAVTDWPAEAVPVDQTFRISAKLPGAQRIALLHNERELGALQGDRGVMEVRPPLLGIGTVELQPVGWLADGREVRGTPHRVQVVDIER
ncbi:MAG: hypothetical protein HY318_07895 [Armatimonadetes bacterium]|nr:hypothetical protein [Armatimonadota bacterium]